MVFFFPIWVFHVNLSVLSFSFLSYLPLFSNKVVSKPSSSLTVWVEAEQNDLMGPPADGVLC